MSLELMMWFMLATKMAVTALFVTAATIIAERLGAMVGALVATLPVSAGPVYVFLALDHDSTCEAPGACADSERFRFVARRGSPAPRASQSRDSLNPKPPSCVAVAA